MFEWLISNKLSIINLRILLVYFCLHHHRPPWIRSLELFQHRWVAIVSWDVHDLFFLWVCSWRHVSEVWCCPFFQDGWSRFVCIWISRLVFQRSLALFLWLRFLFCLVLYILWHFLENTSLQLLGESCLISWLPMLRYRRVVLVHREVSVKYYVQGMTIMFLKHLNRCHLSGM